MRVKAIVQIFAALAVVASSSPISTSSHVVHERRSMPPPKWSKDSRLHPNFVFPIRIGLSQQNLHRAEEFINRISNPLSTDYGKHWSPHEVTEMFAPSSEATNEVRGWLSASGVELSRVKLSQSKSWLEFNVTAQEAERLLRTEYHLYSHETGDRHIACEEYSIPSHLTKHIDIITPAVDFDKSIGTPRRMQERDQLPNSLHALNKRAVGHAVLGSAGDTSNPKHGPAILNALVSLDNCDAMVTPACLQALYGAPVGSKAANNNTLGVVEYTPQAFLQTDLDLWFEQFSPPQVGQGPITHLIDGAIVQTRNQSFDFNGESSLDLQYAMALVYPQAVTLYQVGDLVTGASFNNFLDAIDGSYCTFQGGDASDPNVDGQYPDPDCGTVAPTNVISTSYSFNEADLTPRYEERQCLEYMKLGLQGVSILYSSGDFGVAGNGDRCINPADGTYNDGKGGIFNPTFPGTCPWITSVGATQIANGSSVRDPEIASQRVIFSGGGFSNVFPMPTYQEKALSTYFSNNKIPYGADRYNNSQAVRGFPDVSANGVNYVVAVNGEFSLAYGTSASAPTFAAFLNMINEERIAVGKGPVGFVNPVLYANPEVLTDITLGGNPGCGTPGFNSTVGWDPVTGLGTPNYPAMLQLFMGLP
ncbi:uncharacterized protein BP5553_06521 [Venustampulla echinocandica]|uniref:tripeptidyl-peptidase II n=1 Tax=Venustampulla echinocandica TaxID=2656787 RepID=A0A370TK58_9HELO|nr:uncharacterized protein BP5553_06521 [Venustampulla echinocandica]RDL35909.1 hypothetical protein BP5553_06521 [Venustampulla echinocandica]